MLLFRMPLRLLLQVLHAILTMITMIMFIGSDRLLGIARQLRLPVVLALLLLGELVLLVLFFVGGGIVGITLLQCSYARD